MWWCLNNNDKVEGTLHDADRPYTQDFKFHAMISLILSTTGVPTCCYALRCLPLPSGFCYTSRKDKTKRGNTRLIWLSDGSKSRSETFRGNIPDTKGLVSIPTTSLEVILKGLVTLLLELTWRCHDVDVCSGALLAPRWVNPPERIDLYRVIDDEVRRCNGFFPDLKMFGLELSTGTTYFRVPLDRVS